MNGRLRQGNWVASAVGVVVLAMGGMGCASSHSWKARAANDTSQGPPLNAEIAALLETYARSLNEANVDLVRSVYADDAVFIGAPFPTATGRDAIVARYADFLGKLNFNVRFEVLEVELVGNLGFVRTRSTGTIVPKGQAPKGAEGNRELFVVKKVNGAWKFYRYIFNPEV